MENNSYEWMFMFVLLLAIMAISFCTGKRDVKTEFKQCSNQKELTKDCKKLLEEMGVREYKK